MVAIRQQQAAGDMAGSIEPLRKLLAERPDDPEANFLYGRALVMIQQPSRATWALRRAMEDPEWLVLAGTQLAHAALIARDFNEAVEITGRILEHDPEETTALLLRASAYVHWKKDPEHALADANRVLELDPDRLEAFEPKILALVDLGRMEEASEALAEAGRRLADESRPELLEWHCVTTGVFEQEAREIERARETFARCLEEYPDSFDAVQSAMGFHDALGEPGRSLEILRAAFARAPQSRNLRVELAQRLRAQGEVAEAERLLREAIEPDDPGAAIAWMDLGKFRQTIGQHEAAGEAIERSVELARADGASTPQLEFTYADALVLAGRLDDALEAAEGLSVPAHRHLIRARVAQTRREPQRALEEFTEALRLWPDNPWARYHAALAAEELGDFDRAIEEYRYSIRISPGATDARTRVAALLLAERKPRLAMQMLAVNADSEPSELEGQLLSLRLMGILGNANGALALLTRFQQTRPAAVGRGWAQVAEGVAERAGPGEGLRVLQAPPGVDFTDPRYAAALRARVRLSYEAEAPASADAVLQAALAAHPDSGVFQEIRGLSLELSGSPPEAVRAAYERALELEPTSSLALAGLGRAALGDDPEGALAWFDRAAAADPADAAAKLGAARALVALGKREQAAERLDALLLEHPFEAEAAAERARLDVEQGIATPGTLERAQRAGRFGGDVEALELMSEVYTLRGEPERAAQAAALARERREEVVPEG
jgi:tetratricopeptide (TPR) repeat protein